MNLLTNQNNHRGENLHDAHFISASLVFGGISVTSPHTNYDFSSHRGAAGRQPQFLIIHTCFQSKSGQFKRGHSRSISTRPRRVHDIMTAHLSPPPPTTIHRCLKSSCKRLKFKRTVSRGLWGLAPAWDVPGERGSPRSDSGEAHA